MKRTPQEQTRTEEIPYRAFESVCYHALGLIDQNREYLQMHLAGGDVATKQALEDIERESARLERTVGELLELAALRDAPPLVCGWVDVRVVLAEVKALQDELTKQTGVQLEVSLGDMTKPCIVIGDLEAAETVCFHLLSNALRASSAGDVVAMTLTPKAACWELTVADRGCGLPRPENWQENRRRFLGGAGAGLRLCERQCTRMGWLLELLNNPGGGALARVTIPAQPEEKWKIPRHIPNYIELASDAEPLTRLKQMLKREGKLV